jgi:hypothetical protein
VFHKVPSGRKDYQQARHNPDNLHQTHPSLIAHRKKPSSPVSVLREAISSRQAERAYHSRSSPAIAILIWRLRAEYRQAQEQFAEDENGEPQLARRPAFLSELSVA